MRDILFIQLEYEFNFEKQLHYSPFHSRISYPVQLLNHQAVALSQGLFSILLCSTLHIKSITIYAMRRINYLLDTDLGLEAFRCYIMSLVQACSFICRLSFTQKGSSGLLRSSCNFMSFELAWFFEGLGCLRIYLLLNPNNQMCYL